MIAYFGELAEPNLLLCWLDYKHKIFIPLQVHNEIQKNQDTFSSCKKHLGKEIELLDEISAKSVDEFRAQYPYLGDGEISVILCGISKKSDKSCFCILDDGRARKVAKRIGINFTGTFGMLKKLVEKNKLTKEKFDSLLEKAVKAGFRIDVILFK